MHDIHIGIIEDRSVVRRSLELLVESHPAFQLAFAVDSIEAFLGLDGIAITTEILLDVGLPGLSGIAGIPLIRERLPSVNIIVLTTFDDTDDILRALKAGAASYISKKSNTKTIAESIFTVHRGGAFMSPQIAKKVIESFLPRRPESNSEFTPRQREIIDALVIGKSYKQIAAMFGISFHTVNDHVRKIYKKLEVNTKAELIFKISHL